MLVNIGNAVKKFFPNPSLELVYFEAIANAIDAGATQIDINIDIRELSLPDTLKIEIKDNGCGFNDDRFKKFNQLLSADENNRKGIGRLVYLRYFQEIEFTSYFGKMQRQFLFTSAFDGQKNDDIIENERNGTIIRFSNYSMSKIGKGNYIDPKYLANEIRLHFYPTFLQSKKDDKELIIRIRLSHGGESSLLDVESFFETVSTSDFPTFTEKEIQIPGFNSLFPFTLKYHIKTQQNDKFLLTFAAIDDRTVNLDLVSLSNIPAGCHIIFILEGMALQGKSNSSRLELDMTPAESKALKKSLLQEIHEILEKEIPEITKINNEKVADIENKYPHLNGYFDVSEVGLLNTSCVLENAQKKFFQDQKDILEATDLSDEQFERSMAQSSRILAEYILYRTKIIEKLRIVDKAKNEAYIHNLIVPQRKEFKAENIRNDIYLNNAWILDDKFMNYQTILSEQEIGKLYQHLDIEGSNADDSRPDIAIILSNDVKSDRKIDVVIVELKKVGLKLAKKEEVISQLKQRARLLLEHYPDKIQRIWFYAVIDLDKEFIRSMKEDSYAELYSTGKMYYKEHSVIVGDNLDDGPKIPMGIFVMDYDALIDDAKMRNTCFLNLLKSGFKTPIVETEIQEH